MIKQRENKTKRQEYCNFDYSKGTPFYNSKNILLSFENGA
jgi:hypothetical protein